MGIPYRELQRRMTSYDLSLYIAYDRLDPFTREREDLRAGIICDILAKVNGVKNTKPSDFMPQYDAPIKKAVSPDVLWNKLKTFSKAKGAEVK